MSKDAWVYNLCNHTCCTQHAHAKYISVICTLHILSFVLQLAMISVAARANVQKFQLAAQGALYRHDDLVKRVCVFVRERICLPCVCVCFSTRLPVRASGASSGRHASISQSCYIRDVAHVVIRLLRTWCLSALYIRDVAFALYFRSKQCAYKHADMLRVVLAL